MLVIGEARVAPWGHVGENKLHHVADEQIAEVGLDMRRQIPQPRDLNFALTLLLSWERVRLEGKVREA